MTALNSDSDGASDDSDGDFDFQTNNEWEGVVGGEGEREDQVWRGIQIDEAHTVSRFVISHIWINSLYH